MGNWLNDDNLFVKFGVEEGQSVTAEGAGGLNTGGSELQELTIEFDFADLAAFGNLKIMSDVMVFPDNFFVKSAELLVTTAFAGATATLGIGLIQADDRATEIDADGIDVAIAVTAIDAIGDTITCDGALIGTKITEPGLLTMTVGTANFTAGVARLTVKGFQQT